MIDILFLSHNRREFTKASLAALAANTNWDQVARMIIYDDASVDGTRDYLSHELEFPVKPELRFGAFGAPVAVMNHYLCSLTPERDGMFAKIDSDTMVPPGWLDECLGVFHRNPELDLLGIEAFREIAEGRMERSFQAARHIGGIGVMRSGSFVTLPRPNDKYFGFTAWQEQAEKPGKEGPVKLCKGWIDPSLPVFLLDRLPREPWLTLSREYVERGWQRPWHYYPESHKKLWSWWCQ